MEYHGCIAKYEIYGAIDVAFSKDLTIGVHIECVLVANDVAPIDHAMVSTNSECHSLVLAWSS